MKNRNRLRRLAALLAAVTAFVVLLPAGFAMDKPDLSKFPEQNVILATGDAPTVSLNGLEKNADERAYPASITKVLTALVALEQGNMNDLVTISAHAVKLSSANAKIGVKEGEVYRLLDLMYGMLLPSGCDAARAVAEQVGGSEEGFAALMNEKAQALGMTNSHFTNASGLHDDDMYTTARDLAILGAAAAQNTFLCEIMTTRNYSIKEQTKGRVINVRNIDRLVNEPKPGEYEKISALYEWCIGGKTGSTNAAGRTYMAMARKDGVTLVCVLLGDKAPTTGTKGTAYDKVIANRFVEARSLFEYGYSYLFPLVNVRTLKDEGLPVTFPAPVHKDGEARTVPAVVQDLEGVVTMYLPARLALAEKDRVRAVVSLPDAAAPVQAGDLAGEVTYYFEDRLLFTLPLVYEFGLELDPTPSPAAVLTVEPQPLPDGEASASGEVHAVEASETSAPQGLPLVYILLPLAALAVAIIVAAALMMRKKRG